jgi:hypothetical protein
MPASRPSSPARLGCGFILLTVLVSCTLLALNGMIVSNVLDSIRASLPPPLNEQRWMQTFYFLGPVLLLVVQCWAYDVAVDWLWPIRQRATKRG